MNLAASRRSGRLACAAALAVAAGVSCSSFDSVPTGALTRCEQTLVKPGPVKTDILFVVDDSGSMANAQSQLQTNFQAFVNVLANSAVENNFQIGVTTSSVHRYAGTGSYPETFNSCGTPIQGSPYPKGGLVSVTPVNGGGDTGRLQSTTGTAPPRIMTAGSPTLASDFTENVYVGVCGSGKEQGLEAAKLALDGAQAGGVNDGFLRPGARLAVVIVSDDDDCSDPLKQGTSNEPPACTSYPIQPYVDYFHGAIGGEARPIVFGLIISVDPADPTQPQACTYPGGTTTAEHAAVRYRQFGDAFAGSSYVDSVCNASFHDTLVRIAGLISGQVLPLDGTPPDWRLLVVAVNKANGTRVACTVSDTPGQADVTYLAPTNGGPAQLRFSGACLLEQGDKVDVKVVCAG